MNRRTTEGFRNLIIGSADGETSGENSIAVFMMKRVMKRGPRFIDSKIPEKHLQ
jgi:hypothetical protein